MFTYLDLSIFMGFAWMISGIIMLVMNRKMIPLRESALLLLLFGLTLLDNFIKPHMFPQGTIQVLYLFSRNSYFLIGPFLWFYLRALLSSEKPLNKYSFLHFLPFTIWLVISWSNRRILSPIPILTPVPDRTMPFFLRLDFLRDFTSISSRVIYCFFLLRLIGKHGRTVPDFYSVRTIWNTLSWLFYLVWFYLVLFLFDALVTALPPGVFNFRETLGIIVRVLPSILFIFLFSLFARNQSLPEDKAVLKDDGERDKYNKSGLGASDASRIFSDLNEFLEKKKLFTNPELTLDLLAEEFGESRHRLSEVINRQSGDNFYLYINNYRIKEFLTAMEENRYPQFTILAVAMECGFKSNSSFYSFFKKKTGQTPKEYMNERAS